MAFFENTKKSTQLYRYGGREVLRVTAAHVSGDCAAAQHTQALVSALESFAECELLPRAARALDAAAANGTGYAFRAYRYGIEVTQARTAHGMRISLRTLLDAADTCEERVLDMLWTQDGAWQKKGRHHRLR